jgi:hypothetical protein
MAIFDVEINRCGDSSMLVALRFPSIQGVARHRREWIDKMQSHQAPARQRIQQRLKGDGVEQPLRMSRGVREKCPKYPLTRSGQSKRK